MLKQYANVDCSYDLTPEQLYAKISLADALIVRSATKVRSGGGLALVCVCAPCVCCLLS